MDLESFNYEFEYEHEFILKNKKSLMFIICLRTILYKLSVCIMLLSEFFTTGITN